MDNLNITEETLSAEILANESKIIEELRGNTDANRQKVFQLFSKEKGPAPNMLFFAIEKKKYTSAKTMIEILAEDEQGIQTDLLLQKNDQGRNCAEILISNIASLSSVGVNIEKGLLDSKKGTELENIKEILKMFAKFKSFCQLVNSDCGTGDTLVAWAIKNKMEDVAECLLTPLNNSEQLSILKKKETCTENCIKHDKCNNGYNLLMLALDRQTIYEPLIKHILDVVSHSENQETKSDIVLGKLEPQPIATTENSIRLAAKNGHKKYAKLFLLKCLPHKHWIDALLEVGPDEKSAKEYVSDDDDLEILKEFLRPNNYEKEIMSTTKLLEEMRRTFHPRTQEYEQRLQKLVESQVPPVIEDLQKSLQDPARLKNFLRQKMSQKAIEFFYKAGLFKKSFVVPKPSDRSRPKALLFHNSDFKGLATLCYAKEEIRCIVDALKHLGWQDDMIFNHEHAWTFEQLKELLENEVDAVKSSCSMLLLCITSHGFAGQVCGCDGTGGRICELIFVIARCLPKYIPKVLIFDMCQTEDSQVMETQDQLTENNILLLSAAVYRSTAKQLNYLPALAEQMKKADGRTAFHEIPIVASSKVAKETGQIAHLNMTDCQFV